MSRRERTPHEASKDRRLAIDLGAAMLRLPWSVGLWTVQQMVGVAQPGRPLTRTVRDLQALSQCAAESLESPLREFHDVGDQLQAGLVDSSTRLVSGQWREPRRALNEAWHRLGETWDAARDPGRRSRR